MPTNRRKLVTGHLENISGKVFETHPAAVRELIRGRSGVYALYKNDRLYYVGLASNLMGRLKTHLRDRHNGKWTHFSVYLTVRDQHMRELEALILRIASPTGNRQSGRFMASQNLRRSLKSLIVQADKERSAKILGKPASKLQRRKASAGKGGIALRGVFPRAKKLRGWHGDYEYSATLLPNGRIRYAGELYDSPTAAARVAKQGRANGWQFWYYRRAPGEWVRLNTLKGRRG